MTHRGLRHLKKMVISTFATYSDHTTFARVLYISLHSEEPELFKNQNRFHHIKNVF